MIPIRDENPAHRRPYVTWAIIGLAVYAFFAWQPTEPEQAQIFAYRQATIPCEVFSGEPLTRPEIELGSCQEPGDPFFPDKSIIASLFASLFLHGSLGHLLGNVWVLWIFGNNVEDRMGHGGYLVFYLLAGLGASMTHVVMNPASTIPLIGASGAIAGVMGAYLVVFPAARVVSVIPPLIFWPFRVPAVLFLGVWLYGQFELSDPGIAWEAHIGGFVIGAAYALVRRRHFLR